MSAKVMSARGLVWLSFGVLALGLGGCGPSPTVLVSPAKVPSDRGIAVGRVHVYKGSENVTHACQVELSDKARERVESYKLDETGWVFATLPHKRSHLSLVRCAVWNGLFFGTDEIYFDVPSDGGAAYFGDIEFRLANNDLKTTFEVIGAAPAIGGLLGAAATSVGIAIRSGDDWVLISDKSAEAAKEYEARFHEAPRLEPWKAKEPNASAQ